MLCLVNDMVSFCRVCAGCAIAKLVFHAILLGGSYPYMLQVQGNVPDKRLDESLLQPELLLGLVERFIFNLVKRQVNEERSEKKNTILFTRFPFT